MKLNNRKLFISIAIILLALLPAYIITSTELGKIELSSKVVFVILLLGVAIVSAIFSIYKKDKNITSPQTDNRIKERFRRNKPVLSKLYVIFLTLLVVWVAYGYWQLIQSRSKQNPNKAIGVRLNLP